MKKRFLIPLFILGLGALGTATGFAISSMYESKRIETAELIQMKQQAATLEEEEKSKLETILEELTAKYEQFKNLQVAGTTIGAVAGAIVGAILSVAPALINRGNINKAIGSFDISRRAFESQEALKAELLADYRETIYQQKLIIENGKQTIKELAETKNELKQVYIQNNDISQKFNDIRELLIEIIAHNPNLVSDGSAEDLIKKFVK